MWKPKAQFSLHKRPTKRKNRFIYYVKFQNPKGCSGIRTVATTSDTYTRSD